MAKLVSGVLIAVATMAGIYAVAATAATSMADTFIIGKTPQLVPPVEFATLTREL